MVANGERICNTAGMGNNQSQPRKEKTMGSKGNKNERLQKTANGIKTFHYTATDDLGRATTFVRRVRNGVEIENREATFSDVAGHGTASNRHGY